MFKALKFILLCLLLLALCLAYEEEILYYLKMTPIPEKFLEYFSQYLNFFRQQI